MSSAFSFPGLGGLKPQKPGETCALHLPLGTLQETVIQQTSRGQPSTGDRPSQSLGQGRPTGKECECRTQAAH